MAAQRILSGQHYNNKTGEFDGIGFLRDLSVPLSLGGIPAGANGKDATAADAVKAWENNGAQYRSLLEKAKGYRNKLRNQEKGDGSHETNETFDPTKDPRYERLSTERGKQTKKNINEAEAALQAENEGKIKNPDRPDRAKGEPDLDFKIDGPEPYKYLDIKTPVDPVYRPLETQAADIGKNIQNQKAGSSDVLHIVDLKNVPLESKPAFKQSVIDAAGSSEGIIFINE